MELDVKLEKEALKRFQAKIERSNTGCLLWTAHKSRKGYGQFGLNGRIKWAHRVAYEHVYGPIPPGLEVDHICRTRFCVRPDHLRAVSHRQNLLAPGATTIAKRNADATVCPKGHPYSGANLYVPPGGKRWRCCRACKRAAMVDYSARRRVEK